VLPARGCDARKCIKPLAASRWIDLTIYIKEE